jgi:hypothetical protein
MGVFETLNRLGVLSIGRRPEWKVPASTGIPTTATAGVSIAGAVKTTLWVACREELHRRTVRIAVGVYDAATTYQVDISTFNVTAVAEGSIEATVDDLVSKLNADVDISALIVATREGSGADSVLVIRGLSQADYTAAVSATSGTGTISITQADTTSADVRVFLYADGTGERPEGWVQAREGFFQTVDYRGLTERLDTAGFSRMAVEVVADGAVTVRIGPAVME